MELGNLESTTLDAESCLCDYLNDVNHIKSVTAHEVELRECLNSVAEDHRLGVISSVRNENNTTVLHKALAMGHTQIVRCLLDSLFPEDRFKLSAVQDNRGRTTLHSASSSLEKNAEAIECAIDVMPNNKIKELLTIKDSSSMSVLHCAVKCNKYQLFRIIQNYLSSNEIVTLLKIEDNQGMTPFQEAINRNHGLIINNMLESLSELDIYNLLKYSSGQPSLMHQAANSSPVILWQLLQSVNMRRRWFLIKQQDEHGRTVIQNIVMINDSQTIQDIIEKVFQPTTNKMEMKDKLNALGGIMKMKDFHHITLTHCFVIKSLVKWFNDRYRHFRWEEITAANNSGQTPLHLAALSSNIENIECFIDSLLGENVVDELPHVLDRNENTVLHVAVCNDHIAGYNIVDYILRSLPDDVTLELIKRPNSEHMTCLHLAAKHNYSPCLQLLLDSLPPKDIYDILCMPDVEGKTAVHHAILNGYIDNLKCLLGAVSPQQQLELMQLPNKESIAVELTMAEQSNGATKFLEEAEHEAISKIDQERK